MFFSYLFSRILLRPYFVGLILLSGTLFSNLNFIESAQAQSVNSLSLEIGIYKIQAELAATDATREKGLMYRTHLDVNQGMLFIFDQNAQHCFWMKNTLIPLSIAFIDKNGIIIDIQEMAANSLTNHCPPEPILFALEMNRTWFKDRGIKAGAKIKNIPNI